MEKPLPVPPSELRKLMQQAKPIGGMPTPTPPSLGISLGEAIMQCKFNGILKGDWSVVVDEKGNLFTMPFTYMDKVGDTAIAFVELRYIAGTESSPSPTWKYTTTAKNQSNLKATYELGMNNALFVFRLIEGIVKKSGAFI